MIKKFKDAGIRLMVRAADPYWTLCEKVSVDLPEWLSKTFWEVGGKLLGKPIGWLLDRRPHVGHF